MSNILHKITILLEKFSIFSLLGLKTIYYSTENNKIVDVLRCTKLNVNNEEWYIIKLYAKNELSIIKIGGFTVILVISWYNDQSIFGKS